jgi:hypothetical protein
MRTSVRALPEKAEILKITVFCRFERLAQLVLNEGQQGI